jgi:predicted acyl esterase
MKKLQYVILIFLFNIQILGSLEPTLTLKAPMRDGLELLTDLYLPHPDSKNLPCILLRLPGGRCAEPWKSYAALSALGYAVAIQDTRSAIDPEGKTLPYLSDGWWIHQDGYDTVEWLAKSEYTNGKIGTLGFSAAGLTQVLMAPTAPPSLKCQYIGVAPGSLYHHAIFPGGQLLKNQVEGWLGAYARDTGVLGQVCSQPFYNYFWEHLDSVKVAHLVKVPALHYGGWYDTFLQGTLDGFAARQNNGGTGCKGAQKLIIGPWTHYYPLSMKLGDFNVPQNGLTPPFDMSPQCWFDYYLKDIQNGINKIPAITYYVMGPFCGEASSGNVWKSSEVWPIPCTQTPFYLTGEGYISLEAPTLKKNVFSYRYNPLNPINTLGGNNLFLESGPKDQRSIEERSDVVTFTSSVLLEDLEITGSVTAKIFFASDREDTDLVVRLTDVYPDGKSVLILDGIYRTGFHKIDNKEYAKAQELEVDLWSTSLVFAKGHKIRVSISSSNYPKYEKNLNVGITGANKGISAVANNFIYVGKDYPSRIILPVIPRVGEVNLKRNSIF